MNRKQQALDPKLFEAARVDEEAYLRLVGRWGSVLSRLEWCDTEDESTWKELTSFSPDELRKSLGV